MRREDLDIFDSRPPLALCKWRAPIRIVVEAFIVFFTRLRILQYYRCWSFFSYQLQGHSIWQFWNVPTKYAKKWFLVASAGACFFLFMSLMIQDLRASGIEDAEFISRDGLGGRKLLCVIVSAESEVFLGTSDGVYVRDLDEHKTWHRIVLPGDGNVSVRDMAWSRQTRALHIATDNGLYLYKSVSRSSVCEFLRSDDKERFCLAFAERDDGTFVLATLGGVFIRKGDADWQKVSFSFDDKSVWDVGANEKGVYVAGEGGLYLSQDAGLSWQKVLEGNSAQEFSSDDESDEEIESPWFKAMSAGFGQGNLIIVATRDGITRSDDSGQNWRGMPDSGVERDSIRKVMVNANGDIYALAKTGLFMFKGNNWEQLTAVYQGKDLAVVRENLIVITDKDILRLNAKSDLFAPEAVKEHEFATGFDKEPSIRQVQSWAIQYGDVSDNKIKDWRRRASYRALLPDLSLGYDKNVYGSSSGAMAVGPMDWGVTLSWDMGDLIYNPDQTSIDTRSRLTVQLRNDILAEATRLYYERRKLQIDLQRHNYSTSETTEKRLRLDELTALLDRLTGGNFSNALGGKDHEEL